MSGYSELAAEALDQHGDPTMAATGLLAAAVEIMSDFIGPDQVWDAVGAIIDASEAEWRQRHGN